MKLFSPAIRLAFGLASLTVGIIFGVAALGLLPDRRADILDKRRALSEEMAIHFSYSAQKGDLSTFRSTTKAVAERNPEIISAALRRADGRLLFDVGDHETHWTAGNSTQSTPTHIVVPITVGEQRWGDLELCFQPIGDSRWGRQFDNPVFSIAALVGLAGFVCFYIYLRFIFRRLQIGHSSSIPKRVRTTLNTLVEGVVILDNDRKIAIANNAFADMVGRSAADLEGCKVDELSWGSANDGEMPCERPWHKTVEAGTTELGTMMSLNVAGEELKTFSVNSAPIVSDDGKPRGVMATFDNLTAMERKNVQLRKLLNKLKSSRAVIREQNQTLRTLATRDPLTNCLNRRAFFEAFETQWGAAERYATPLSCIMVDVDHFKSINDNHGHSVGDVVLQHLSKLLHSLVRKSDILCRYGGEEFCVLMPHIDQEGAGQAAERIRKAIESSPCTGLKITASLGYSEISLGTMDQRELLNQADIALYAAKNQGRNRAICWNRDLKHKGKPSSGKSRLSDKKEQRVDARIPFHAVTALVSALGHRHADTAEHSRRVSDLCVATATRLDDAERMLRPRSRRPIA